MMMTLIHRLRRLLVAAAFLATASAVAAAPGSPETRVLPNGLRVVLLEDHALPLVSVSLWVGAGSKDEIESSAGYSHFIEHLIQRGTENTGPFEFTRRAQRWGGTLSVRSNYDRTSITLGGVPSALDEMIDAATAMAFKATLKDSEIDLELATLTQEVRTYYDLPSSVAFLETMRAAFPDHPYRWPMLGNFRTIGTLKSDPLMAFYRNLYVPNNMALVVAGDFDPKAVPGRVEAAFGGAAKSATLPPPPPPPSTFAGHADVEKRLDFGESWATLSFVGPGYRHPDRLAFEVLAAALADPASPLAQEVLKERSGSLAQVSFYGLEDAGLLYVALNPAAPDLSYNVAAAAMRGLATFRKSTPGDAAVRELAARLARDERLRAATLTERSDRLGEAALFGGARYYWDRSERFAALTGADLARVAARYLVPENMRLVILVPKSTPTLPEPAKVSFHQAFESLGAAGGNPATGFEAILYSLSDAARVTAPAWAGSGGALREPTKSVLKNGVTVVVLEDHRQPVAGLSLHVRAGSGLDPAGREGLAGLALRMLGARTAAFLRDIPAAPGPPRPPLLPEAQTMRDTMEIRMLGDPAELATAIGALGRALQQPLSGGPDLETARRAAVASLDRAAQDPDAVLLDLFHDKVYAGDPYGHRPDGMPAGLAAVTADEIAAFGASALRPERVVLAVTGDVDAGDIVKAAERAFGGWKAAKAPVLPAGKQGAPGAAPDAPAPAARATAGAIAGEYSRQVAAPQSRALVGAPTVPLLDPDFADLRFLGASVTLLAFEDLVFGRRAAFSAVSIPEGFERGGALGFQVLSSPQRRGEVQFDLQRLLRKMAAEEMSGTDLRDVGRMLAGREAAAAQGALPLASALGYREASGLKASSWRDGFAPAAPAAVRLKTLAETYLRPENWITIVVGPPSP
jgi:zinc protease